MKSIATNEYYKNQKGERVEETSDKDGVKRYITEIVVNEILLMGSSEKKEKMEADLPF
ncbi:single-stranded DNA-binding protein [Algoriphagus aquimarinus]|uniref:single-stranded DNA-binding protein n=1 Tax=Algoriphagus aquimarinus TaxID=237018 RepID=UPI001CB8D4C8|nr:hypothetical protein [Algoriphagus aquimarinus]